MDSDIERYKKMAELSQIGWWELNFDTQQCTCSDFLSNLLGVKENTFPFTYLKNIICDNYRDIYELRFNGYLREDRCFSKDIFPIHSTKGKVWLMISSFSKDEEGEVNKNIFRGTAQVLKNIDKSNSEKENLALRFNDLLLWQSSLFHSLKKLIKNEDKDNTINEILKEILQIHKGDRAYIFAFEKENTYQRCIYEVTKDEVQPEIDNLQALKSDEIPWWTKTILSERNLIISDIKDLIPYAANEYEVLNSQNICSIIIVPLTNENGVWGYIGIDYVDRYHNWIEQDSLFMISASQIINLCITLKNTQYNFDVEKLATIKSKNELDNTTNLFKRVYYNLPIGIATFTADGRPTQYNNKFMDIFGISSIEDVKDYSFFNDINAPADLAKRLVEEQNVGLRLNYKFSSESFYMTKRTDSIPLYLKIANTYNDRHEDIGFIMICLEENDRIMTMNQVREFEMFFSIISEYAKIGYLKVNILTKKGYANKHWYKSMGVDPSTPLSDIIGLYKHMHPDDRKILMKFLQEAKDGVNNRFSSELRIKNPDIPNKWIWINKYIAITKYMPENNEIEAISVNYDITELKESREQAEEADRLKSAFLANMSHEIRTPLNAIVGFSDLLANEDLSNEEKQEYLQIIMDNNETLLSLINDLLDLSKMEAGLINLKIEDVDVVRDYEELFKFFSMKLSNSPIVFRGVSPYLKCVVSTDRNRMKQVVTNFVTNAIKYTKEGHIELRYRYEGNGIKIEVEDTGAGIPKDGLKKVFQRFEKLNSFVQGTGLGLSICKTIVEAQGGKIGVRSKVGKGSTFWAWIPCKCKELEKK